MQKRHLLLGRYLLDDKAAAVLDDPMTPWLHSDKIYTLPSPLDSEAQNLVAARTSGSTWADEMNLSVVSNPAALRELRTVSARYTDQLATHEQPDSLRLRTDVAPLWLDSAGSLLDLGVSMFPNPLGGTLLLICGDNRVVLGQRSPQSIVEPGCWHTTASGSFRAADSVTRPASAHDLVISESLRELHEEMGVSPSMVKVARVAAFTRDFGRGGKPDAHILARTNLASGEIRPAGDMQDATSTGPITSASALAQFIDSMLYRSPELTLWAAMLSDPTQYMASVLSALDI